MQIQLAGLVKALGGASAPTAEGPVSEPATDGNPQDAVDDVPGEATGR